MCKMKLTCNECKIHLLIMSTNYAVAFFYISIFSVLFCHEFISRILEDISELIHSKLTFDRDF